MIERQGSMQNKIDDDRRSVVSKSSKAHSIIKREGSEYKYEDNSIADIKA
jgi:hypothetical protein